jgi:hypothetical protein
MHRKQAGCRAHQRDRREIALDAVRNVRVQPRIDSKPVGRHEQHVAVRRRPRDELGADEPVAAGAVVDDELLTHRFAEPLREAARHDVGAAGRGERNNDADRFGGIALS